LRYDENGHEIWDSPVELVLRHRFTEEGKIEYNVQYVRFPHPYDCHDWVHPEYMRLHPNVYRVYNREHGIEIDEHWIRDEDVEMDEVEDSEAKDDWNCGEESDHEADSDYIP
jgi:hypothetical protein